MNIHCYMSASLLDNDFLKQELHLCDKSKIFPYFKWFDFLLSLSKAPSVIVPYLWPLMFLGEAFSMGYLCVLPCWAGTEPPSGGACVSPYLWSLWTTLDWCLRETHPAYSPFLCNMAHASMQRRHQMSSPWAVFDCPCTRLGTTVPQGILLATPRQQLRLRTKGTCRGHDNILYNAMAISSVFQNIAAKFPKS